jgi:hypothetical protein
LRSRASIEASETQASLLGRTREISVPGHDNHFLISELEGGGEVNGVIAAKSEVFSVLASATSEILVHRDRDQICLQLLEGSQCLCMLILPQSALAPRGCQSRSSLRVGKDAGRRWISTAPEFGGQVGAVLDDDELDQRRGVEVENQARCSETRSDTEPVPLT